MAKKKYPDKENLKVEDNNHNDMFRQTMKLTLESEEEREKKRQAERKRILKLYKKGMTQAEALNALDELSDIVKYDEGLMKDGHKFFKVIMDAQGITEFQALIFSIMFCVAPRHGMINAYEIGTMIRKSGVFVLQHVKEIDAMCEGERRLLMRSKRPYDCLAGYTIRADVFDAVLKNERFVPKSLKKNSVESMLLEFRNLTNEYNDDSNFNNYKFNVDRLLEENTHLDYVKKLYSTFNMDKSCKEMRMFMTVCDSTIRGYGRIDNNDLLCVLDTEDDRIDMEVSLRNGETFIHHRKLVEFGCNDGLADRTTVQLTQKAIKKFLPKVKGINRNENSQTSVIKYDKITKKELFYDDDFVKNVDDLMMLLHEDKFKEIQKRMKAKGIEKGGMTAIVYGAPGTGKTELCKQLARETGRDILQVNISEIRSMWVGESEKNVQAIFDNYKTLCKGSTKAPILLFNEADAIIGKRNTNGDQRAVEKMENSMVTILLQALEDLPLNSIVIATSNIIAQTLDPAFERRFMYKLNVPSPSKETRAKIWLSKMPELDANVANVLSEKFEFSGGEIDNVIRRYSVEEILYGASDDILSRLTELCKNEKLNRNNNRKIGFAVKD